MSSATTRTAVAAGRALRPEPPTEAPAPAGTQVRTAAFTLEVSS